jgi:acyl-CoA dehydrogenase family protein 9
MPEPTRPPAREARPSFLRGLFAGQIHDALLFPYPEPLERRDRGEAATVRRLLRALDEMRAGGLIDSARFDEEETIPDETLTAFGQRGLLGITVPREYGGLGLSNTGYAASSAPSRRWTRRSAWWSACTRGSAASRSSSSAPRSRRRATCPALARGRVYAAYALTEPETGSDAQHIVTRAERVEGGWAITGRKHWIGLAHRAEVITVFAQTPAVGKDGRPTTRPTAFIVRPDLAGFRVVGTTRKMGIRGSTQAELEFRGMVVPDDHVLGEVGRGFNIAVQTLNAGRLSLAAGCGQSTKAVVGEMARYAEQRVQFGAPLASFEITQRKLSTRAAEAYACDAMVGHLSAALDDPAVDAALEAAAAKVFASELVWSATDDLVQVAGGRGYVKPYPYERMLRDARINRIFEGANDVLRVFVALNGVQGTAERLKELGGALRRPVHNFNLVAGYATDRVRTAMGTPRDGRLGGAAPAAPRPQALPREARRRAARGHRGGGDAPPQEARRAAVRRRAPREHGHRAVRARGRRRPHQRLLDERGAEGARTSSRCATCSASRAAGASASSATCSAGPTRQSTRPRRAVAATVRASAGYTVPDAVLDPRPASAVREAEAALAAAPERLDADEADTAGASRAVVGRN